MSMMRLAFLNFRNGFRHYLSLVISLAFTILVLFNFQNIIDSDAFLVLGTRNKEYVDMIIRMISFILCCFMFFFIWYSTNVFLTRRKKEIGIYIFMGLSNERIGKLYLIETTLTGLSALALGLFFGGLTAGLFQKILLLLSDLAVEIRFRPGIRPMAVTAAIYLPVYMIFVIKGYVNIVRSSVLNMISASRQNEYVKQNLLVLVIKAAAGLGILCRGYGLAVKEGPDAMGNAFAAVILVTAGVYLLFGGLIPLVFQTLAGNKRFLYQKQRVLWVNSVIFRMKKNYRTYAMVCILMLCSVTALATGFAMKGRYETIIRFENTYTFQLMTARDDLDEKAREAIEESSSIVLSSRISMVGLDPSCVNSGRYRYNHYAVLPFSGLRQLAEETGMEVPAKEPADDQVIKISHLYLASLITQRSEITVDMAGKTYRQIEDTTVPYLGYLQEITSCYVVSDREYQRLRPLGQEVHTYNYRIADPEAFGQARDSLDRMIAGLGESDVGRVAVDPFSNELDWVKVLYSICIFMFLVFILASGSIMFMKLYNDAFEEKERYRVLARMGVEGKVLRSSIRAELAMAYGLTFLVMGISSVFSVGALGKMMYVDLTGVNLISVAVVLVILAVWYLLSVKAYVRNAGICV